MCAHAITPFCVSPGHPYSGRSSRAAITQTNPSQKNKTNKKYYPQAHLPAPRLDGNSSVSSWVGFIFLDYDLVIPSLSSLEY